VFSESDTDTHIAT